MREHDTRCNRCGEPVPCDRIIVIAYRDGYYCSTACRDAVLAALFAARPTAGGGAEVQRE